MVGSVNAIPTLHSNILSRQRAADLQADLARAQEEVSTGFRSDLYRDLGSGASEAISLRRERERTEAFAINNKQLAGRLEMTASSMASARETAQAVLDLAIPASSTPGATASQLQDAARAALDQIGTQLNASYAGASLFAGVESDRAPVQRWSEVNAGTGLSPQQVVEQALSGGMADAADAQARVDAMAAIFSGGGVPVGHAFEETFYNGAPAEDAGGTSLARQAARIDNGRTLDYGVQANDPGFAKIFQGLAMLAGTDVSQIDDPAAYETYMRGATEALSEGLGEVLAAESGLGRKQEELERVMTIQQDRADLLNNRVLELESVDPYEAATRVTELQSRLEATYAVTARLSKLSFLNFMN